MDNRQRKVFDKELDRLLDAESIDHTEPSIEQWLRFIEAVMVAKKEETNE